MKLENRIKQIEIAVKQADWFSVDSHVNYETDFAVGTCLVDGKITFSNGTMLEFVESVTPERIKYRYQYMNADGAMIFRYDNAPHHHNLATFPHHKHIGEQVIESEEPTLRKVIEEIIDLLTIS